MGWIMEKAELLKAIDERTSRRHYVSEPIEPEKVSQLQIAITEYNKEQGIRFELVLNNGKAFSDFMPDYGMFPGVHNYICLVHEKKAENSLEKLGYFGELLVLRATNLKLDTCWVGGGFKREDVPISLAENEDIACIIIIGKAVAGKSFREMAIRGLTHSKGKRKSIEDLFEADASVPDWFLQGMQAVSKAPSSRNGQPVLFHYKDGKTTATVEEKLGHKGLIQLLDFGIAKLHFELGATNPGKWNWGNGGEFDM